MRIPNRKSRFDFGIIDDTNIDPDPEVKDMGNTKIRWDLLPIIPLEEAAKVMTFGASKYCDSEGWREIPLDQHYAALLRHLVEWKKAHDHDFQDMKYDHESRLHHLAHIIARACFIIEIDRVAEMLNDS